MTSNKSNLFKFDNKLSELLYSTLAEYGGVFEGWNKKGMAMTVWYPEFVKMRDSVPEAELTKNSNDIDRLLPETLRDVPHLFVKLISETGGELEIYIYEEKYQIDLNDPYYSKGDHMVNQLDYLTMSINESIIKFDGNAKGTYIL